MVSHRAAILFNYGLPIGEAAICKRFKKLIKDHDLPEVVFHSLRHTCVTDKLKLNGGDIKAVQGDSGHAQVNMVTDVQYRFFGKMRELKRPVNLGFLGSRLLFRT